MTLVSGDIHGGYDIKKLSNSRIRKTFGRLPDHIFFAGDFAVPWSNNEQNRQDLYYREWFKNKPYDCLVVPGNHENYSRIAQMPEVQKYGATLKQYSENIFFIPKNSILTVEGKTFYCFGGAYSTDQLTRCLYIDWWPEEDACYADYLQFMDIENKSVDYIITHTAPNHVVFEGFKDSAHYDDPCGTRRILDEVDMKMEFKHWYFGHFHRDEQVKGKYTCLFNRLAEIKD